MGAYCMTQDKISTWQNFANQNWDKQDEQFSNIEELTYACKQFARTNEQTHSLTL